MTSPTEINLLITEVKAFVLKTIKCTKEWKTFSYVYFSFSTIALKSLYHYRNAFKKCKINNSIRNNNKIRCRRNYILHFYMLLVNSLETLAQTFVGPKESGTLLLEFHCDSKFYFWNCSMIGSDKTTPILFAKENFCLIWVILKVKLDGARAY